jgi:MoxR-like ATPase
MHFGLRPSEYECAASALAPILDDLPGKVVAIDGYPGVGKSSLGRFLAWRFNISLIETDFFLIKGTRQDNSQASRN